MKNPGPTLEELIDYLILIPGEFTGRMGVSGPAGKEINVPAIVNDTLLDLGGEPLSDDEILKHFPVKKETKKENGNYTKLVSILCYIYNYHYFQSKKTGAGEIKSFLLSDRLKELSQAVLSADEFITDADRREELCRTALDVINYYPDGENEKNAIDRLRTLDSVERKKILAKTAEAQKRAKELKEAMMRKEAEEAASKMSRE